MYSEEIEKLFTMPEMDFHQHENNVLKLKEYSRELNKYFINNYKKRPEILLIYFRKMQAEKLISVSGNIEIAEKILNNNIFFKYFKDNNLSVNDLVKILTIYNNSYSYYIENEKKEEELVNKNIKKMKKSFDIFMQDTKNLYDFELWFYERSVKNLRDVLIEIAPDEIENEEELFSLSMDKKIDSLLVFNKIFENYFQDMKNMYKNKKTFNPKEKNTNINYFIRELISIFETINKIKISNEIIIELVSLLFDKQMDDTQLNNIVKNSNKHISNTSYTLQFTTKKNSSVEVEYIKSNKCF